MEDIIGLAILASVLIGGFTLVVLFGNKRKKELKQLAESMNFSFDDKFKDEDDALLKSLSHLALFQKSGQEAWNVMRGQTDDIALTIMDHRYSSGSSGSVKPHNVREQTVIVFQSDFLNLPSFTLRTEDLAHKISTSMLGNHDIDFDDHPAFSKQYHLHGNDEESIRQIFNDEVVCYFEEHGKIVADGSGGDSLMFCRLRKTVAAKDIKSFLEQGFEVFSLFKGESQKAS